MRRVISWGDITAEAIRFPGGREATFRYSGPLHLLVLRDMGVHPDAGRLTLVPAGSDYGERLPPSSPARRLHLYVAPAELSAHAEWDAVDLAFSPRPHFEDAALVDAGHTLLALLEAETAESRYHCEALAIVLVHGLVRLHRESASTPARGGLAAWQQRLVAAYIGDHLADDVSLATLARLAHLSPYHFARAFKHSFAMPPHRYLVAARIQHAKRLLAEHELSVTGVAAAVGFRELSSFSNAFRRLTGVTPSQYRRSIE